MDCIDSDSVLIVFMVLSDVFIESINFFIPKFLKWTLLSLNVDMSTDANKGFSLK